MLRNSTSFQQRAIRFSRTIGLPRAVAKGCTISIGLGIFILGGFFLQEGSAKTPQAYLAATLLALPFILTYAERAAVIAGSGGVYGLVRASGSTWRTYMSGWLLIGGHLALIALLGWGAALYLHTALSSLLQFQVDMRWLAAGMVSLVALSDVAGIHRGWRLRVFLVYTSIGVLALLLGYLWLQPAAPGAGQPLPLLAPAGDTSSMVRLVALMSAMLWSINFIIDSRDEMHRPSHIILPALLLPLLLSGLLGMLIAATVLRADGQANGILPLAHIVSVADTTSSPLLQMIYLGTGFLISLVALSRAMVMVMRLTGTMVRDGFLPRRFWKISLGVPLFALGVFAVPGALAAALVPKPLLAGLVAISFLLITALLLIPDTLTGVLRLPETRVLKLPLHPFFPIVTTATSLFLAFALSPLVLLLGWAWLLLGVLHYAGYARQGGIEVRRRDTVVTDVAGKRKAGYTILVGTSNPQTAPALLRAAVRLARVRQGRILVLRVVLMNDQLPQFVQRQSAQSELQELNQVVQQVATHDVQVETLVRLSHSPVEGILSTAREERINLIVLGWEGEYIYGTFDLDPLLDPIIRTAVCDVVVIRGSLPEKIERILVPTAGSPNSLAAMKLAQDLVCPENGHIVALHMVQEVFSPNTMDEINRRLWEMINSLAQTPRIEPAVIATDDVKEGIVRETQHFDALLLGASRGGALDQTIFGGLPVEVAQASLRPSLLVKHYEGARLFWSRRLWETISAPFPTLTVSERGDIYQQMRRSGHPSVDFFILIALSAMIATLGLMQSSPAVIIGAMLVAPLMSPILAMSMSIVQGDLRLLRVAAESTLSGILLAMGVSIVITLTSPTHINTSEILARTQPNLLDLLVALASGAAGGYAAARKEVAAALPGVAISAALVPPLGVSGYGISTGQFEIAGGSLLLFTTNMVAIVVAAAAVFLLLGFRPERAGLRVKVQLKLLFSLLALLLISIPLAILSINTVDRIARQNQVESFLNSELASDTTHISEVSLARQQSGFLVQVTIYTVDGFGTPQLASLEQALSDTLDAPVTLRATVLRALLLPEREQVISPSPTPQL